MWVAPGTDVQNKIRTLDRERHLSQRPGDAIKAP
jgi:hypothetical protein